MNVFVLKVPYGYNEPVDFLYPVVLQDDESTLLIDCGYESCVSYLEKEMLNNGLSISKLTGIVISHHDIDHMGGLGVIKSEYPHIKVYSSAIDEPYISGKKESLRLAQARAMFDTLPEEYHDGARQFEQMLTDMKTVPVDFIFEEDEKPVHLKGIEIIHTPGHMPGHISLYLPETKTLIAADALVIENGELEIANPRFTIDMAAAVQSVKKLSTYPINKVICYHGGIVDDDIAGRLAKLMAKYSAEVIS